MTEKTKNKRTQLTDLPIAEQEITGQEMKDVKGGGHTGFLKGVGYGAENPKTALPPSPGTTTTKTTQSPTFGNG